MIQTRIYLVSHSCCNVGYPLQKANTLEKSNCRCASLPPDHQSRFQIIQNEVRAFFFFRYVCSHDCVMCSRGALLLLCCLFLTLAGHRCEENFRAVTEENALAKLVKMFSKPGAFKRVSSQYHNFNSNNLCEIMQLLR